VLAALDVHPRATPVVRQAIFFFYNMSGLEANKV
jgi:hypothetical protein